MPQSLRQMLYNIKNKISNLTQPPDSITNNEKRQQIRLVNLIVLTFVPLAIIAGYAHIILYPVTKPIYTDPAFLMIILSSVLLFIGALLGRYLGYWGTTGFVFVIGFFVIMFNASFDSPDFFDTTYLILLSILASVLFNIKWIALTAVIEVIAVNLSLTRATPVNSLNLSIFLVVTNLIIICTVYYRKMIEKEGQQKLVDSEAFLRLITKQMPVSVWITDEKLVRRATFGRVPQIDQLATMPDRQSFLSYYQALAGDSVQFENRHNEQYYQYRIEPMRDDGGNIIGTLGVATDITEQKLAQDRELQLQLERERVDILSKFIEHSSHDLRTPISNINTYLYLLENTVQTDKERDYIHVIREQSERLHGLINNMLMLQRLELETEQNLKKVSVKSLLDSVETAYRDRIQSKQIEFKFEPPSDDLMISAVEKNIYLAISKVMDNAIQFTPADGSIRLYTTADKDCVTISVQDTGIGISEEQLPQIFEIFYRADDSRPAAKGDNGLGLTIVDRIVKSHRGKITVESALNEGTTFHMMLPSAN